MTRLVVVVLFLSSMVLAACNTFEGMGKDTQETGAFISGEPRHDAYHTDARDF
jgi:predicted small secreted protein